MNRILLALLMVTTHIVTLAQLPDFVPTEGLLLYAPLDESGLDFSDSLNHGAIEGPIFQPTPDGVESVYFDGNGRINFGDVIGIGGDEISISLKFYPTLDDSYGSPYQYIPLVSKWVTGPLGPTQNSFLCAVDDGDIRLWIAQEESESSQTLTLCPMPSLFEWHHLVITFESGAVTTFLDGELVYSNDYSSFSSVITDAFSDLLLGDWYQQYSSNYSGYTGHMRDFGVWNESLTIDQVLALNGAALGCTDSTACNYDDGAEIDDDSCTWGCEFCGEGTTWDSTLLACVSIAPPCTPLCGIGTVWDPINEECIVSVPTDTDFDGCVTAGDVLNLLATFGTCPPIPQWPGSITGVIEDIAPCVDTIYCAQGLGITGFSGNGPHVVPSDVVVVYLSVSSTLTWMHLHLPVDVAIGHTIHFLMDRVGNATCCASSGYQCPNPDLYAFINEGWQFVGDFSSCTDYVGTIPGARATLTDEGWVIE